MATARAAPPQARPGIRRGSGARRPSSLTLHRNHRLDRVPESLPALAEVGQRAPTGVREPVVAPRRAGRRLLPLGYDLGLAPHPGEEWINGPLADQQPVGAAEAADQFVAVVGAFLEEPEHAVREHTSPQLGVESLHRHTWQSTASILA